MDDDESLDLDNLEYLAGYWKQQRNQMEIDPDEMLDLIAEIRGLQARISAAEKLVEEQSEDPGLWFQAETAPEDYLQVALRRLHAAIEGEDWKGASQP